VQFPTGGKARELQNGVLLDNCFAILLAHLVSSRSGEIPEPTVIVYQAIYTKMVYVS